MLNIPEMRQRDLENRARKNAHKKAQPVQITRLEDVLRSTRQKERQDTIDSIVVLRDKLAYAKGVLALTKQYEQVWHAEAQQRGEWFHWARGQAERDREKLGFWERLVRTTSNDLRGQEAKLKWLERRGKVAKLHTRKA